MLTDSDFNSVLLVIVSRKLLIEIQLKFLISVLEQCIHVLLFFCSDNKLSKELV